jgi:hypothetical protein
MGGSLRHRSRAAILRLYLAVRAHRSATWFLAALLGAPGLARAQAAPPAAQRRQIFSRYEEETIKEAMGDRHLSLDASPEGKIVERIDVVALPPFEPRDLVPAWVNVFHVTTRESVVRREVLLRQGGRYEQALVDDSIRNLRRLPGVPQLSAVLMVAARGSAPDRVILLVITKDVWSLRLNWTLVANAGGIDQLYFQPSENNFLGTHQVLFGAFILEPSAYTLGLGYFVPRLAGSRVTVSASADTMINRATGSPEGTYGQLVAGQPLFSGRTEWAWDALVSWQDVVTRRYVNAQLSEYVDPNCAGSSTPPLAACTVPFQFRSRVYTTTYELTRSFGWDVNHDFTLAASVNRAVYQVNPPPTTDAQTTADFVAQSVPVSDTRVGPSLQYHSYRMRFLRVVDFDTLALQEDYRLGHDVVLRVYPSFRALGSSRDVVGFYGAAQYTWAVRDGLFRVAFQSTTEPQVSQIRRIADASLQPWAHLVSPTIAGLGRIVVDGSFLYRWRNYLNQITYLGGDDRARGFPTNFFVGSNVLAYNIEARSRPAELLSCELAGVAFVDLGDAYTVSSRFRPYQSVGVGVRALFPWLDRAVFRAELGFPAERPIDPSTGSPIPPFSFLISFGQAFITPTVAPTPVLATGQGPDSP